MEELSSARAARSANRMIHEVQHTTRLARPPRADPPAWSRDAPPTDEEAAVEEAPAVVSARPAAAAPPPADAATTAATLWAAFLEVETELYLHLDTEQRRRLRLATCPPHGVVERTVQSGPLSSLATAALAAACLGAVLAAATMPAAAPRRPGALAYRAVEAAATSSTCRRAVDRMVDFLR